MSVRLFVLLMFLVLLAVDHFLRALAPSASFERAKDARSRWTRTDWAAMSISELLRAGALGYAIYLLWPR